MIHLRTLSVILTLATALPALALATAAVSAPSTASTNSLHQALNDAVASSGVDAHMQTSHSSLYSIALLGMWTGASAITIIALSTAAAWISAARRRIAAEGEAAATVSSALLNASMQEIAEDYLPSFSSSHAGGMSSHRTSAARLVPSFASAPQVQAR